MESPNQLKNRFDRIQQESLTPKEELVVIDAPAKPVVPELMLQASQNPELQKKLRSVEKKDFDWKAQFKNLVVRPNLELTRSPLIQDVEWTLQALTHNGILVSFTHSKALDQQIEKLAKHLKQRKKMWTRFLTGAEHFHVFADKNKLHLSLRYSQKTDSTKGALRSALEEEYLSGANSIKTFYMKGQDDWIEIILELTDAREERRREVNQ